MRTELTEQFVLVVEGEAEVRDYLEIALRNEGLSVETAENGADATNCFQMGMPICAVLLDMLGPGQEGLQVLRKIRNIDQNVPVIVMSNVSSSYLIVEAMRRGANDFLSKPISHESLRRALANIFGAPAPEVPRQMPSPPQPASINLFFGSSPSIKELHRIVAQVAWSEAPVLIQGETGAGKEVLARHLHALSPRAQRIFVKLNCAALPSELVESELFGYERGAFTGAFQRKLGMFEIADSGTLLLDEIGDMDAKLQAKLLQVLQDHEFHRLGGKEIVRVDVRVIAATHQDLEKSIAAGTFRQDLYYRLNVVSLHVPPLREIRDDIVPLTRFLLKKHTRNGNPIPEITPALEQALRIHDWPGNVRELENVVRKLTVLRDPDLIVNDLTEKTARKVRSTVFASQLLPKPETKDSMLAQVNRAKQEAETEAIVAALKTTNGNRKKAARLLKIDYKGFLYKMKKLGIGEGMQSVFEVATEPSELRPVENSSGHGS
jgi:two-component system response regulator AtoC